jgi:hypothetical protein
MAGNCECLGKYNVIKNLLGILHYRKWFFTQFKFHFRRGQYLNYGNSGKYTLAPCMGNDKKDHVGILGEEKNKVKFMIWKGLRPLDPARKILIIPPSHLPQGGFGTSG